MSAPVSVTGMVIKAFDHSEYDKRLILLTRETDKVTVFAKGVKRQGSRFMASCEPFNYGNFKLFEGRSAYNLSDAEISNYFEGIRLDMENMVYASFFCDITEYCTRENMECPEILKLLYRAMQALLTKSLQNDLICSVFVLKLIMLNGEYPGADSENAKLPGTIEAIRYIQASDIKNLFSFKVTDEIKEELMKIAERRRTVFIPAGLKSLEVIKDLGYNI